MLSVVIIRSIHNNLSNLFAIYVLLNSFLDDNYLTNLITWIKRQFELDQEISLKASCFTRQCSTICIFIKIFRTNFLSKEPDESE